MRILCDDCTIDNDHNQFGRMYCYLCQSVVWWHGQSTLVAHFDRAEGSRFTDLGHHKLIYDLLKYVFCAIL